MMPRPLFVTGTDTGVGKTVIACALLRLARNRGLRPVALKPIAAGCIDKGGQWRNDDALALMDAADTDLDYASVNPVALELPIAPHLALARTGRAVAAADLADHCRRIIARAPDLVVIEGAGGWLVPLNDTETLADIGAALDADVVLVVGMKLGCLNHALLTAQAIEAAGVRLAGWVANCAGETMPFLDENVATLRYRLTAPCLGVVPRLAGDLATAAMDHLHIDPLLT